MNKSITKTITFIASIAAIVVGYLSYTFRDKLSGYSIDLTLTPPDSVVIQVGVGISNITPSVDGNKVWIAGFDPGRKAIGTHDSLWARAMVIDDGKNRLALVSIDAIGLYHNNIIGALQNISEELSISYAVVSSTHSHEAPDLMGLWGPSRLRSGVDKAYMRYVQNGIIEAISKATYNLEPSYLVCAYDLLGCKNVVKDTRDPIVYDSEVRVLQALSLADNSIITTLVSTGNHPESMWNKNQYISSDFPHYVRKTLEDSIGGTAIFMQGCLGGLMCPHPSIPVVHPISGDTLVNASWERTEAIGMTIADAAIRALEGSNATIISSEGISLRAKSFSLKISNKLYILAACCGLLNADTYGWKTMRSEVSAFTIGPASFCTIPGELYPEIANGGVMVCEEGDYVDNTLTTPIESPSLRSMMSSEHSFVFGLANDEIGYIIPYTQWDAKRPFAFDMEEPQYGEANSVGPNAAPIIYQELSKLIKELHEMSIDTL